MQLSGADSQVQNEEHQGSDPLSASPSPIGGRVLSASYPLALALAMSTWFIAIRAPLRLDETGSYWQISKGFSEIISRQGSLSFAPYSIAAPRNSARYVFHCPRLEEQTPHYFGHVTAPIRGSVSCLDLLPTQRDSPQ